ncbi:hypothetical protein BDV96DRAFT_640964 [Lophiotrema nucula]|uniref:GATA-type domain-containing protein n=1 Tax=Lophiotrema nucula TaxID=690887 RepID=A0A6A5ZTE6_9PLEO|nr:hypothetical protein BDV96DRAFT_640964 [Lophiotrema nucula]
MSFGFSVGDIIAGANLLITSINALNDGAGASFEYRAVTATLHQTTAALQGLNELELVEDAHREALEVAASQCGVTILQFVNRINKFETRLGEGETVRSWKGVLRKLEWSLYSKDEVRRFQAYLQGDLLALQTTLQRVHLAITLTGLQETRTTLSRVETRLDEAIAMRSLVLRALSRCFIDFRGLFMAVFCTNLRVISCLLSGPRRPPQIQEERPIYVEDPHGRTIPILCSWIEGWDDFDALLKIQFKRLPGLKKIAAREYLLKDVVSSAEITQSMKVGMVFVPGKKITMSMVFTTHPHKASQTCPKCFSNAQSTYTGNPQIECSACGLYYSISRLTRPQVQDRPELMKIMLPVAPHEAWHSNPKAATQRTPPTSGGHEPGQPRSTAREVLVLECIEDFSRIHIVEVPKRLKLHAPGERPNQEQLLSNDKRASEKTLGATTAVHPDRIRLGEALLDIDDTNGRIEAARDFSRSFVKDAIEYLRMAFFGLERYWQTKNYFDLCMRAEFICGPIGNLGFTEAEDALMQIYRLRQLPDDETKLKKMRLLMNVANSQFEQGSQALARTFNVAAELGVDDDPGSAARH